MYEPIVRASDKPTVKVIPATKALSHVERQFRKQRVCAYGRVSTDHEEQQTSFEAQKTFYTDKIKNNPDWDFVGFYSDEGITGTSVKKRIGFMAMIEQCKARKIDLILTKSISRFSRNTLDSIEYVRMLKRLGIGVVFEKESINTLESSSELLFTVLSALAQEEINSMSKNISFGHRERARQGKVVYHYDNWYGYKKGVNGKPEIVPEEAKIVEKIFAMYLSGDSIHVIAKELNDIEDAVQSKGNKWSPGSIRRILINEKYCGNVLSQKTFTVDPISKVTMNNNGQLPQYLAQGVHDAIITEQTFNIAQLELARRNDLKKQIAEAAKPTIYSSLYALSEKLHCSKCNTAYKRKTWKNRDGSSRYVWLCINRADNGKKSCDSPAIDEYRIHNALLKALNAYSSPSETLSEMIARNVQSALITGNKGSNPHALRSQIDQLQKAFSDLIELSVKAQNSNMFDSKFKSLSEEITKKKLELEEIEKSQLQNDEIDVKLEYMRTQLLALPAEITEYDDKLVRQTVKHISVIDEEYLKITFISGSETTVKMEPRGC